MLLNYLKSLVTVCPIIHKRINLIDYNDGHGDVHIISVNLVRIIVLC